MNRIDKLFKTKGNNILSIYITAGYPNLGSTAEIIRELVDAGTDMIEIGIPFSDPLADGPVIQDSSAGALKNGMKIALLFEQLKYIRSTVNIPLVMMSYINPVIRFGLDDFCRKCNEVGVDGLILPDLPPEIYLSQYANIFNRHDLYNILLISPQTDIQRIRMIDSISRGFVYVVSSSSTTGVKGIFSEDQILYFKKIRDLKLTNPALIGFGISDADTFHLACNYANGVIIGSAFISLLKEKGIDRNSIREFVDRLKNNSFVSL